MADSTLKALKVRAHHLKPIIWLGQHGLTDAVINELDIAFNAHELIKVKIPGDDREARKLLILSIQEKLQAQLIQLVGKIVTFYRKKNDVPTAKVKKAPPKRTTQASAARKSPRSR
jgi:RNA-binding protein